MDAPAFDPNQPFETVSSGPPPFDPSKPFEAVEAGPGQLSSAPQQTQRATDYALPAAIADVPHEIYQAGKEAAGTIADTLNPFSEKRHESYARAAASPSFGQSLVEGVKQLGDTGAGLAAIPSLVAAPVTGAARSLIGHPFSAVTGIPYPEAKQDVDLAMSALAPGRGGLSSLRGPVPVPPNPTGPLGVTLSEGQRTGELPLIRTEQAAARGQLGPRAEAVAKDFLEGQGTELAAAKETIARGLDPFGAQVAQGPQEAGALVSKGVQDAAAANKAAVDNAYARALAYPGEIEAQPFSGVGQRIKQDLSGRPEPVIIDDKTTPHAAKAIDDLDATIDRLRIQNKASPFSHPPAQNIVGISLEGLDQARKRLSTFRNDAWGSGNRADGRAASALVDAFDRQVDSAIQSGLFKGDPRAVQAWWDARAAHAAYKNTFGGGKNDPVGRVVEKILGKGATPSAIPNDVADFIYGSTGTNPSTLNVAVANRVKSILGDRSPEWSGVKQGLFSRIVEPPPGVIDWGPQKVSQRLNRFLNGDGKELADAILSPAERSVMQQYANLQRQLIVPPTGANRSETSTFMAPMLRKISGNISMVVLSALGHAIGLPWGAAEVAGVGTAKVAGALGDIRSAQQVAKQMPQVSTALAQWRRAVAKAQLANSPISQKAVGVASANLVSSLQRLGIDIMPRGVGAAAAQDDQRQK